MLTLCHELALRLSENRSFSLFLGHVLKGLHVVVVWVDRLVKRFTEHLHNLELRLGVRSFLQLNGLGFS